MDAFNTKENVVKETDEEVMDNFTKIMTYGSSGTSTSQLNGPSAIALDPPFVFIGDYLNSRVLKWKLQGGAFVSKIDSIRAVGLEVIEDKLYVAKPTDDKVHMYDTKTLTLLKSTSAFNTLVGMTLFRNHLYVVDYGVNTIYKLDPNTLETLATLQVSATSDNYKDIAALGSYLFLLTDANEVFRIAANFEYDNHSLDLSSYLSAADYINATKTHLFVTGSDTDFIVMSVGMVVVENPTYDTDDWNGARSLKELMHNVFIAADYAGDQLVMMYGYDPDAGKEPGDDIGFDGDWGFDDEDVVISGDTGYGISTETFVKSDAPIASRYKWSKG